MRLDNEVKEAELRFMQENKNAYPKFLIINKDKEADIKGFIFDNHVDRLVENGLDYDDATIKAIEDNPSRYRDLIICVTDDESVDIEVR